MKPALPRRLSLQPGAWTLVEGRRCCIHQVLEAIRKHDLAKE